MRKQVLSILLTAVMLLTMLTGCTDDASPSSQPASSASSEASSSSSPSSLVLPQISASPQIIGEDDGVRIIRLREESDQYYINVLYGALKVPELDAMIKDEVYRRVDRFEQHLASALSETSRNDTYLTIDYEQVRYNADIVTLVFESREKRLGQFIHDSFTLCMNTSTAQRMYLKDFVEFDEAKDYLIEQSAKAVKKRYPELDEGMVRDKIRSNLKNDSDFFVDETTLTLLFDVDLFGLSKYGDTVQVPIPRADIDAYLKEKREAVQSQESQPPQEPPTASSAAPTTPTPPAQTAKVVCLTFDDGPHPTNTPALLNLLEQYGAKATFFVVGSRVEQYGEIVGRAASQGHAVGNHTYSHQNLTKLSQEDKTAQVDRCARAIENACGIQPRLIRPPYGARLPGETSINGEEVTLWDIDPQDWKYRDAQQVAEHVLSRVQDGSIVLLHDLYATSVEAAGIILQELSAQGYRFITVEELRGI